MSELKEALNDEMSENGGGDLNQGGAVEGGTTDGNTEAELLKKLENALDKNTAWLEQVKLTLLAVYGLFKTHESLKKGYEFVLSEANKILEDTRGVYNDTLALKESTAELNEDLKETIKAHLKLMELKSAKLEELVNNAREIMKSVERFRDEVIEAENNIAHDKEQVKHFVARVEALKLELDSIDTRLERAATLIAKFETLYGEKKAEFTHTLNEAIAQFEGFKSFVDMTRADFESQKEQIKAEINEAKEEAKEELKESVRNNLGAVWSHIFDIERLMLEKGLISLEREFV
ncbi:hypothetical protein [Campylobacter vulpis]|uniref:hypothetical protein n=1 Tax=Campylobacter vulpis TaxID=1655500 RepID=UPI001BD0BB87|nr:hypothetical protein [Campylobacter vulpis]MBS4407337.1 hypothetical protein [Campylobacter vulpis]